MTHDDIIRMASEAGFERVIAINPNTGIKTVEAYADDSLERFARLVAEAEREACAQTVEDYDETDCAVTGRQVLAMEIRARGES